MPGNQPHQDRGQRSMERADVANGEGEPSSSPTERQALSDRDNQPGAVLTCTNEECGCQLTIEVPCPHGSGYQCACGHAFGLEPMAQGGG